MSVAAANVMAHLADECTRLDVAEIIVTSIQHAPADSSMVDWLLEVRPPPRRPSWAR